MSLDDYMHQVFADVFNAAHGRQARWRYFEDDRGRWHFWSTEPVIDETMPYESGTFVPVTKSGRAMNTTKRKLRERVNNGECIDYEKRNTSRHKQRNAAKARAERLYWEAQGHTRSTS